MALSFNCLAYILIRIGLFQCFRTWKKRFVGTHFSLLRLLSPILGEQAMAFLSGRLPVSGGPL